jgi:transcriptional regulator with XRE-family HTH domain
MSVVANTLNSTSAVGAMLLQIEQSLISIGFTLDLGTSATPILHTVDSSELTNAGVSLLESERAGPAIAELRRLSGFTWDQLARLFNVNRRSLHFWASGKPMTREHEEHLQRLLATIRIIDRGSASANRDELLTVREDGNIPFDLLADGYYGRVISLVGYGYAQPRVAPPSLSGSALIARIPRPPEELVGALQDRVHRESGAVRAAKSARTRGGR